MEEMNFDTLVVFGAMILTLFIVDFWFALIVIGIFAFVCSVFASD